MWFKNSMYILDIKNIFKIDSQGQQPGVDPGATSDLFTTRKNILNVIERPNHWLS